MSRRLASNAVASVCLALAVAASACGSRSAAPGVPPADPVSPPGPVPQQPQEPGEPPPAPAVAVPAPPEFLPPPRDTACDVLSAAIAPIQSVGLTDPVDPANAPVPANEGERLVFRQLYESLVRIDCERQLRPGLAELWRADGSGGWIITLRADARFADGTPVTAAEVLAGWMRGGELAPRVGHHVESAAEVSARVLAIRLRGEPSDAPVQLAYPELAVTLRVTGLPWPIGTRGVMARESRDGRGRPVITLLPTAPADAPAGPADTPPLRFVGMPPAAAPSDTRNRDERDFLDEGIDLLVTRNPATLEYAATLPQVSLLPLPWSRTHVYLSPAPAAPMPPLSDEARQALAVDAVRGESRGAQAPFWWSVPGSCELPPPTSVSGTAPSAWRIVHDAADSVARSLAERLVSLASDRGPAGQGRVRAILPPSPPGTPWRATGLSGQSFLSALRSGTDAGYVLRVEREPIDACDALRDLRSRVPWMQAAAVYGLVDTRLRAIVRQGRGGLQLSADGTLLIAPAPGAAR